MKDQEVMNQTQQDLRIHPSSDTNKPEIFHMLTLTAG